MILTDYLWFAGVVLFFVGWLIAHYQNRSVGQFLQAVGALMMVVFAIVKIAAS